MDEFNQNFNNHEDVQSTTEPMQDDFKQSESVNDEPANIPNFADTPVWNKVEYTPVTEVKDYKPISRGLKIFCIALAAVVLLTAGCAGGYFLGRKSKKLNYIGRKVEVDLAARPTDVDPSAPAQLYEMLNESIVGIRVYNDIGQAGDASGVIYSEDGFVITNDHIYADIGAPKFKVYMHDGTEYDATYVAGDTISDLAVLKIESDNTFKPAVFGDSETIINGEPVVAIGRPNDATDSTSITSGLVSLTKRRVKSSATNYSASLIQTDSAINPGSSGGALVNMYGQVIGITSSKLAGVEYDAIGFAIPSKMTKRVVEQLVEKGKVVDRAKLGITYTEINSVRAEVGKFASVGLLVESVSQDSDIFGKIGKGDIITHINEIEITSDDIILDVIEECRAGDVILITVLQSNGNVESYEVKLRANISESSYMSKIPDRELPSENGETDENPDGGTFDFPYGE